MGQRSRVGSWRADKALGTVCLLFVLYYAWLGKWLIAVGYATLAFLFWIRHRAARRRIARGSPGDRQVPNPPRQDDASRG